MATIETGNSPVLRPAGNSGVSVGYIAPAATFTATTASSGGAGKTTLTSAGAHGLTSAIAVGKHLYISAGTNWTVGFYPITAIDLDTTGVAVTITYTYSASLGSPTIALAGTEVTFATVSIPALRANSFIKSDGTWSAVNNANAKNAYIRLGGTAFYNPSAASLVTLRPVSVIIQNRNSTSSQIGSMASTNQSNSGTATASPATGSIDTSVATSLTFGGKVATANDYIYLERYLVEYYL